MSEITEYIATLSNEIDKIQMTLQEINYDSKELEYAIQKLSEAVFWLSYVEEDLEDNNE